jgi:hypothetical protein
MQWLPTALSTVAAGVAVWCAWMVSQYAASLSRALARAERMRSNVVALEGAHEQLMSRHRKLEGAFHRFKADFDDPQPNPAFDAHIEEVRKNLAERHALPCVNWTIAQEQGPSSAAARCECGYCERMREVRATTKASLIPKTHADRVEAIERGLST